MPPDVLQLQLPLPTPQPGSERQETLADRLCDLLIRRGRPLEVGHVVAQVLRVRNCPQVLQRRLVAEIVDADQRLTWRSRDLVGLAPPGWASTPVHDATYCVVDLETTGGVPGRAKITEIGAVRIKAGQIIDRYTTLVNPGHQIPGPITRITGLSDDMLVGKPTIDEVMDRFVEFVGDDVMVAHNAPFDLRFLNFERFRISGRYFTQPWLDTLVLARRLLRKRVERFDLSSLAFWADTQARPNHRALPDAEATAEVLARLLDLLVDRGIGTLERAVAFGQTGGTRHAHKLSLADNLPQSPGVYLMRDRSGAVLYVGKARNLRRRVRSYFGPQGTHGRLIARALDAVAQIDHYEVDSELTALLTEARLIREHQPPCNTRGVRQATRFLKLTLADPLPRLFVVSDILDDGAVYFGPVRSDRTTRLAVAALHEMFPLHRRGALQRSGQQALPIGMPVPEPDDEMTARQAAEQVAALLGAPLGQAASLLVEQLAVDPRAAALLASVEGREAYQAVMATLGTLGRLRGAAAMCGVICEEQGSRLHATFVGAGRVVETLDLVTATRTRLDAAMAAVATASREEPGQLRSGDLDEAILLSDWLRSRADQPGVIVLTRDFRHQDVAASLCAYRDAHPLVVANATSDLPDAA